VSLRPMF